MLTLKERAVKVAENGFELLADQQELMEMSLLITDTVRRIESCSANDVGNVLIKLSREANWRLDDRAEGMLRTLGILSYYYFDMLEGNIED